MMKSSYAERKSFGRESFQRKRKLNPIERNLDKLRRAVKTNNANLWKAAENRFLDLINLAECEGLSSQTKGKYLREYHNIRPPEEIIDGVEGLEKGREKERTDASKYRHGDNTTLKGICSSEIRRYYIYARGSKL